MRPLARHGVLGEERQGGDHVERLAGAPEEAQGRDGPRIRHEGAEHQADPLGGEAEHQAAAPAPALREEPRRKGPEGEAGSRHREGPADERRLVAGLDEVEVEEDPLDSPGDPDEEDGDDEQPRRLRESAPRLDVVAKDGAQRAH